MAAPPPGARSILSTISDNPRQLEHRSSTANDTVNAIQHTSSPRSTSRVWLGMDLLASPTTANTASTASPYVRPCDDQHFRVVIIEPGRWEETIRCRLSHRRIDQPSKGGSYKALSYVWGSRRVTENIQLNDCQLRVTLNLFCALLYLRHTNHEVMFWIDALVSRPSYALLTLQSMD